MRHPFHCRRLQSTDKNEDRWNFQTFLNINQVAKIRDAVTLH